MISTGLQKLDEILGGGIKNGNIIDIYGESSTGKTQLALQIIINFLSSNEKILFLDTTGEFRPERLLEIMNLQKINVKLLDNIMVSRITNTSEQVNYFKNIPTSNYGLIIIDNVSELFSFEYSKDEQSLQKTISFMNFMHELSIIALEKKIPIIVTNTVRHNIDKNIENLSRAISFFTHVKIRLSKSNSKHIGYVESISNSGSFSFLISAKGLEETYQSI
ncbi:MAG: recombinase RecA [Crenarchaeota archaeon]|nr:MAG: recombinase RecA [Thermoproteota archaeon]RDJ33384.1 MAG: recombinase RecA [Thermoproteota archaeon]RDJ36111.1 MAG: recombinase RecA [Thermoproteota archaeon]RDJ38744.1 MAG: recombinase RecA [Thermoproteota archaeon]